MTTSHYELDKTAVFDNKPAQAITLCPDLEMTKIPLVALQS